VETVEVAVFSDLRGKFLVAQFEVVSDWSASKYAN